MSLTDQEILERKAAVEEAAADRLSEQALVSRELTNGYTYVRPFSETYDGVVAALENPDDRIMFGLVDIDALTRGFGPKELILIAGFAHAGKTQLANTMILNNKNRRILFFSMDDPAEMILIKLACMHLGISAEELEHRIRKHDAEARRGLQEVATAQFSNLLVVDESLGLTAIDKAVAEATSYWGAPPELIIIDYLSSMQGNGHNDDEDGGVKRKVAALKRWCKAQPFPTVCLHQNTRSRGGPGEPVTLMSVAFGGEQEATMIVGVRRKKDSQELDEWARNAHEKTITLHVVKNKRPPGRCTPRDGVDLYMEPLTGVIRMLRDEDWPSPPKAISRVGEAVQAVSNGG